MHLRSLFGILVAALFVFSFDTGTADAKVQITINKTTQRMLVVVDGKQRYNWKVSTGKIGYSTPSGTYRPFRMERDHYSKEWDDAPMPHSIFFTTRGHAIHGSYATRRLGSAASHGCVRLAPGNAAKLYSLVGQRGMGNTSITITGGMGGFGGVALSDEFAPIKREVKKVKKSFGDWLQEQKR
jgi:hypothetical protein